MLNGTETMERLLELHTLEDHLALLKRRTSGSTPERILAIRAMLPEQLLAHHDRLRLKGRRSISDLSGSVCSACHITIPIGERSHILSGKDIVICQNCGRFVAAPTESVLAELPQMVGTAAKIASRPRGTLPKVRTRKLARLSQ